MIISYQIINLVKTSICEKPNLCEFWYFSYRYLQLPQLS